MHLANHNVSSHRVISYPTIRGEYITHNRVSNYFSHTDSIISFLPGFVTQKVVLIFYRFKENRLV